MPTGFQLDLIFLTSQPKNNAWCSCAVLKKQLFYSSRNDWVSAECVEFRYSR